MTYSTVSSTRSVPTQPNRTPMVDLVLACGHVRRVRLTSEEAAAATVPGSVIECYEAHVHPRGGSRFDGPLLEVERAKRSPVVRGMGDLAALLGSRS